jgi:hypothetical protein
VNTIRTLAAIAALAGLTYVVVIVYLFWQATGPVIEYEEIDEGTLPATACPGQPYSFEVVAIARRAPAAVVVVENWVSVTDPRVSYLDDAPEWRIVARPVDGRFVVRSHVPDDIEPGRYRYLRSLGLSQPIILEVEVLVATKEVCNARQPSP